MTTSASPNGAGSSYTMPEALITSKFWVLIQGVAHAYFRECSGLQLQTDVFEYAEGGLNTYTHKLPVRTKVGNITLKHGLVQDDDLWTWYSQVVDGTIKRRSVTIQVYENKVTAPSNSVVAWTLRNALPIKWTGPAFKANESAVAVTTLEFVCDALVRTL